MALKAGNPLVIDGAQGEGGGQILRTALTLSMLKGITIEVKNIRQKRKKPGLLRQHLTCVQAAKSICDAEVEGDYLGSSRICFKPNQVKSGRYRFSIGTAGSTVLVCQTILLPLLLAKEESEVKFEGGTHNGLSPSLTFFEHSFLSVLKSMGAKYEVDIETFGFNPAGGGKWTLKVFPIEQLSKFELTQPAIDFANGQENCSIKAIVGLISRSIAEREIIQAKKKLGLHEASSESVWVESSGPGNSFHLKIDCGQYNTMFDEIGQLGISAERVANRCAGRLTKFIKSGAAIEEHLADQLLLPLVVVEQGGFTTTKPSAHTLTNIAVIQQLLGIEIQCNAIDDNLWRINLSE